ncbi:MAG: potassium channel family protein [Actinomycetota bacterium]|nr:potassium channel family protein [Actinomycetota bacterium]
MAQARGAAGLTTCPAGPSPWRRLRWSAAILVGVAVYGILGYMVLEGWSFLDAAYMVVLILSSVGFREVRPLDTGGQLFTISLMVLGVTLLLVTVALVAQAVAEGGLGLRGRRRRMQRAVDRMRGHFIVCGYGRVGRTVAREFEGGGAPFVVVDYNQDLEAELVRDGVVNLIGDSTSDDVLRLAGIDRASALISTLDSDANNVFVTIVARALNPDLYIVARASEPTAADRMYKAGADRVVSPYVSSGRHMALLALRPRVVDYMDVTTDEGPGLRLEEVVVEARSRLEGRLLSEIAGDSVPLVVKRADGELIQSPDPTIRVGDGDVVVLLSDLPAQDAARG